MQLYQVLICSCYLLLRKGENRNQVDDKLGRKFLEVPLRVGFVCGLSLVLPCPILVQLRIQIRLGMEIA